MTLLGSKSWRALLEAIPVAERTSTQWIALGRAEAVAATRRATASEACVLNDVAEYPLDAATERRDVQPLIDDVERARTLIDEAARPVLRAATLGTFAELHRRLGAFDRALAYLAEADGVASVVRARVLLDQAKRAMLATLAKAHPESLLTLEAKRLGGASA